MPKGSMMAEDTRDIAVGANTKVDQHIVDCLEVRKRNEAKLDKIDSKLDRIVWIVLPILGGIILASHAVDWVLTLNGHK